LSNLQPHRILLNSIIRDLTKRGHKAVAKSYDKLISHINKDGRKGGDNNAIHMAIMLELYLRNIPDISYDKNNQVHEFLSQISSITTQQIKGQNFETLKFKTKMLTQYIKAGHRLYDVTDNLATRLLHTDIYNLKAKYIKLPYDSICIHVPNLSFFDFTFNLIDDSIKSIGSIYLANNEHGFKMMAATRTPFDDIKFIRAVVNQKEFGDHNIIDSVSLTKQTLPLFKWVVNVLMYITWPDLPPEIFYTNEEAKKLWSKIQNGPDSKYKTNLINKLNSMSDSKRVIILGNTKTVIDRSEHISTKNGDSGQKMNYRELIPGHWKMQPYGPNNSLRKYIHIDPYWRGPKDAPIKYTHHIAMNKNVENNSV